MNKSDKKIIFTVGKELYSCAIYAPQLIEVVNFDCLPDIDFKNFISKIIENHKINQVVFYFIVESLVAITVPWSIELLVRPKKYIEIFINPLLPINHGIEDYYFWYKKPVYANDVPIIATNLEKISDIKKIILNIKSSIRFTYINEITDTLNSHYQDKGGEFNAIIPSMNDYFAVSVIDTKNHMKFLGIVRYKDEIHLDDLEKFKFFLMMKLPNFSNVESPNYRLIQSTQQNNHKLSKRYLNVNYIIFSLLFIILTILFISITLKSSNENQLSKKLDDLQQKNNELTQSISYLNKKPTNTIASMLKNIDISTPSNIYVQRIITNNLQDHTTSFILSGKSDSFLSLDSYITTLKSNENIINVDLISSFEDNSTIPSVISFDIKISIKNIGESNELFK